MKKVVFTSFSLAILLLVGCGQQEVKPLFDVDTSNMTYREQKEEAIQYTSAYYKQKKEEGMDFTNGPCLAEEIIPGWAADIAHFPREEADDQAKNQCDSYRSGKVEHYVELTPEGTLIQAK